MNERYARQTGLPEIGPEGQKRIGQTAVLVIGAGGLGVPVCLCLAGAGIGCLGIIDDDVVSLTNLHRQVLYAENEVGQPKATTAAQRLSLLNSGIGITPYAMRFTPENAESLISQYDIVVDGTDNYATRYLIDDITSRLKKPYIYGAVGSYEGQVSVFNAAPGYHRYRDLYPTPPPQPTDKSIIGPTPAVVGSVMAHEVLKLVCGYGRSLSGRLWTIDLRSLQSFIMEL